MTTRSIMSVSAKLRAICSFMESGLQGYTSASSLTMMTLFSLKLLTTPTLDAPCLGIISGGIICSTETYNISEQEVRRRQVER